MKRLRLIAMEALLLGGYHLTPMYKLSEAVYFEAVYQTAEEQDAIRWVIVNRKDMDVPRPRSDWPDTIHDVIIDGAERGNNRDFTYLDHHGWMEDWPVLPYAHAVKNGNILKLLRINAATAWFLLGYWSGLATDPTEGSVFYKVTNHKNSWFEAEVKAGRMCNPVTVDAHTFYHLCVDGKPVTTKKQGGDPTTMRDVPISTKGSKEALMQAYYYATSEGYHIYDDQPWWWDSDMATIEESESIRLHRVTYPYLIDGAYQYLLTLASQYHTHCGEPLTVTSALRTPGLQGKIPNGSDFSVHPTGLAFDLSVGRNRCQEWLETVLMAGEERGYLQITREQHPPHWHVVVYPTLLEEWRANKN